MKIESRPPHLSNPMATSIANRELPTTKSTVCPSVLSMNREESNPTVMSKCLTPKLVHPCEIQKMEKPNLSMQNLLLTAFSQSEEYQKEQINYLYDKQSHLIQLMSQQKQKIIELHKNSNSVMSSWQSTIDIALPLCSSVIALYLGFSPAYPLSKIPAICMSILGFSIAGLKMGNVAVPNSIPASHMAICNIYMAYMNPSDTLTYITTFLQTLPLLSEFACNIDNNSICSDEALAQKMIKNIDRELKQVTLEISRAMKMIAEKRKFFSITTDYTQLQSQIAAIGAV